MTQALWKETEEKTRAAVPAGEEDYLEDGLLHCGRCHTPKQCRIEVFGRTDTPMCLCRCAQQRLEAEREAQRRREFEYRVRDLKRAGFPSADMEKCAFDRDDGADPDLAALCRKYVAMWPEMKREGKGLLLYGDVGCGKTFMAACIANALMEQGVPCMVTNFSRLINTLSGMWQGKQEWIDSLNRFPLLVIDDLAAERDTEYAGEIVYSVIDARCRAGLPLIVTTNLTGDEMKHPGTRAKERAYSRLFEMCLPVRVRGKDRRKARLKQEYEEYMERMTGHGVEQAEGIALRV